MSRLSHKALKYYLYSIFTLAREIRSPLRKLGELLLPHKAPVAITLRSGPVFYLRSLMDLWILKEVCIDCDYQKAGASLQSCKTIIDIGAGIGEFSVLAALRCPDALILAFEPDRRAFDLLNRNLKRNEIVNVRTFNAAVVGKTSGDLRFLPGRNSAHSSVQNLRALPSISAHRSEGVMEVTLAEAIDMLGGQADLIKLDAEGSEYEIISDGGADLSNVAQIVLEWHTFPITPPDRDWKNLQSALVKLGFTVRKLSNPVHNYLGFLYARRGSEIKSSEVRTKPAEERNRILSRS